MAKFCIEILTDAHDDVYYRVTEDSYILMDKVYSRKDFITFLKAKIKKLSK